MEKKKTIKVNALDVIRAFYVSDKMLGEIFDPTEKVNKNKLKRDLKRLMAQAEKISKNKLLKFNLDNYSPRYDNYLNSEWELKEINLGDCGVWPKMGGLPDEATKGNVADTARYIRPFLKNKRKLTLRTGRILYIEQMMKYAVEINSHIPIIVLEDGVIRHTKLRKPSQRKMYKKVKYDIDDGNHRAIAMALLGKKKIKALVGKRICKNKLIYF